MRPATRNVSSRFTIDALSYLSQTYSRDAWRWIKVGKTKPRPSPGAVCAHGVPRVPVAPGVLAAPRGDLQVALGTYRLLAADRAVEAARTAAKTWRKRKRPSCKLPSFACGRAAHQHANGALLPVRRWVLNTAVARSQLAIENQPSEHAFVICTQVPPHVEKGSFVGKDRGTLVQILLAATPAKRYPPTHSAVQKLLRTFGVRVQSRRSKKLRVNGLASLALLVAHGSGPTLLRARGNGCGPSIPQVIRDNLAREATLRKLTTQESACQGEEPQLPATNSHRSMRTYILNRSACCCKPSCASPPALACEKSQAVALQPPCCSGRAELPRLRSPLGRQLSSRCSQHSSVAQSIMV
eukprot:6189430-Pleurochrysis_carterae.AAC.5